MSESQRFAKFIQWIWSRRDVDKSFHVESVTSKGSMVAELPQPPLSLNEAKGLFRFLASKNLVAATERDDEHAGLVYSLNIVEHYKWGDVIRDLAKPDWQRSWFFLKARDRLFWAVTLVIAAFLGASGKPVFEIVAHKLHWIEEPPTPTLPVVGHEANVLKQENKPNDTNEE